MDDKESGISDEFSTIKILSSAHRRGSRAFSGLLFATYSRTIQWFVHGYYAVSGDNCTTS
jgi:hypothetical protein